MDKVRIRVCVELWEEGKSVLCGGEEGWEGWDGMEGGEG